MFFDAWERTLKCGLFQKSAEMVHSEKNSKQITLNPFFCPRSCGDLSPQTGQVTHKRGTSPYFTSTCCPSPGCSAIIYLTNINLSKLYTLVHQTSVRRKHTGEA